MPFFEISKLRERTIGSATDTSQDGTLENFGSQADSQVYNELYLAAVKYGKKSALPAVDTTNGKIGGDVAPQDIKDACTDRAVSLYWLWLRATDVAKMYRENSNSAIQAYVTRLSADEDIMSDNV